MCSYCLLPKMSSSAKKKNTLQLKFSNQKHTSGRSSYTITLENTRCHDKISTYSGDVTSMTACNVQIFQRSHYTPSPHTQIKLFYMYTCNWGDTVALQMSALTMKTNKSSPAQGLTKWKATYGENNEGYLKWFYCKLQLSDTTKDRNLVMEDVFLKLVP